MGIIRRIVMSDAEEAFELMTNNTVEAVTESELRELAADPEGKRAYVGYEPSGVLHLGHMVTATKLMELQEAGFEVVVLLADIHASLNDKGTLEEIREIAERMQEKFVAFGLDPEQTEFLLGSEFQLDDEYVLDQHEFCVETSMNRANRSMGEIAGDDAERVSHAVYPLMQALDIKHLDVDLAVGGMEQRKVHMLARDVLPKLGEPAPTCLHTPLIADLETGIGKMSSSDGVTISIEDSTMDIAAKVDKGFCPPTADPDPEEQLSSDDLPDGVEPADVELENPVLQLFEFHVFPRFNTVTVERDERFGGDVTFDSYDALEAAVESGNLHPEDCKAALADALDRLVELGRRKLAIAD
ncbi:tyrosyl-tRNA ligase [Natronorubrum tibetense GA33]|uniref:Tyrosine--tRNA ligase n=2 Tax=Natronorubrum tibetense TaxID=63128 RepID=L9VGX3_9EURY|nr:tyrosyl-tRNA ligase [Natronorubrum tibetense GA33]